MKMTKKLLRLLGVYCFYSFVVFSSLRMTQIGAKQIYGSFKDEKYPGNCVIDDSTILSPMETMKDPFVPCGLIICGKNSKAEFQSCPLNPVAPNCKLAHLLDPSQPFPQCCEREIECWN